MEKHRFKNCGVCVIEIEAPLEKAIEFINKYYPTFKLITNEENK